MISLEQGLLAMIQYIRDVKQLTDQTGKSRIAIPPGFANTSAFSEYLVSNEDENPQKAAQLQYEISKLVDTGIVHPLVWDSSGPDISEVFSQVLDARNTEVTASLFSNWMDAQDASQQTISSLSDVDYLPSTIDKTPHWQAMRISGTMFTALIDKALGDQAFIEFYEQIRMADMEDIVDVKEIRFEMASITVDRPWFKAQLLESRHWRLRTGATINGKDFVSKETGPNAFSGALPAYPSSFVFIRNLEFVYEVTSASTPNEQESNSSESNNEPILLGPLVLQGLILRSGVHTISAAKLTPRTIDEIKFNQRLKKTPFDTRKLLYKDVQNAKDFQLKSGAIWTGANRMDLSTINWKSELQQVKAGTNFSTLGNYSSPNSQWNKPSLKFHVTSSQKITPFVMNRGVDNVNRELTVIVKDTAGKALKGAEIILRTDLDAEKINPQFQLSDQAGKVTFSVEESQKYSIIVSRKGYQTAEKHVGANDAKKSIQVVLKTEAGYTEEKIHSITSIQLLAVVYHKLGNVPDPVPQFDAADDHLF